MRYPNLFFACAALLLGAISAQAASLPESGQDNRLAWEVKANWKTAGQPVDLVHSLDGKLVFILNNEHQVLVYDNKGELQGRIPVGEGVTAIDIAPQGEGLYLVDSQTNSFTMLAMDYVYDIDITGSPFMGKADAPVTVAVFTDFE